MSVRQEPFEKTLERLEAVVARLESGEIPLEKGVALFREGMILAASCRKRLEDARMEIAQALAGGGEKPFADREPAPEEERSDTEDGSRVG